jgi:hypothetical protein
MLVTIQFSLLYRNVKMRIYVPTFSCDSVCVSDFISAIEGGT